jgi:hypothetical protein
MKQITLPFPFIWLTIRVELAPVARRRASSAAPSPPVDVLKSSLKQSVSAHLLQDIGLDDSRRD